MTQRLPVFLVIAVCGLPLAGCDRHGPEPAAPVALVRPVLALKSGATRVHIPAAALVERNGLPGVLVLTADGQARLRLVRTGKPSADGVEILSGLDGSETLVLGDLRAVRDGSPITVQPGKTP